MRRFRARWGPLLLLLGIVIAWSINAGTQARRHGPLRAGEPVRGWTILSDSEPDALAVIDRARGYNINHLDALPGIDSVAIGSRPVNYLAGDSRAGVSITLEGGKRFLNGNPEDAPFTPGRRWVTPGYFEALGLPLVMGRSFTDADRAGAAPVGVINETMARMHWPGQNPIGKRLNFENVRPGRPLAEAWTEIVGVVADARQHQFDAPSRPEIYTPLAQTPHVMSSWSVLVRSATPPAELTASIRRVIHDVDPAVPAFEARTMTSIIDEAIAIPRYAALLVGLFAMLALVLAAVGLHGLGAFAVAQRTREIGLRIALGATRADVARLIAAEGLGPAVAGLAVGTAAAVATTRLLSALLYETEPSDPIILVAAMLLLLLVAISASYLPARRATRVDPIVALKTE